MSEKKGWSKDQQGLTGKRTEHHDSDDKVTGSSRKEEGLSGEYTEHRDSDGKVTGHSTKQHGLFKGDYVEHRDKDGKVIGSSKKGHGLTGDYVEHRDRDDRVVGWSRNEQGPFKGKYTKHHGTSYRYSNDEEASEPRDSGGSSSGGSSGGSSGDGAAAGAGILLIPLALIVGAGWLLFVFFRWVVMAIVNGYRYYKSLDVMSKVTLITIAFVVIIVGLLFSYDVPLMKLISTSVRGDHSIAVIDGWRIECAPERGANARCWAGKDGIKESHIDIHFVRNLHMKREIDISPIGKLDIQIWLSEDGHCQVFLRIDNGVSFIQTKDEITWYREGDTKKQTVPILEYMMKGKVATLDCVKGTGRSVEHTVKLDNFLKMYSALQRAYEERAHK